MACCTRTPWPGMRSSSISRNPWAAVLTHGHHKLACHHSQQPQLQLVLCDRNHCDAKQPPHETGKLVAPVQVILRRSSSQLGW